MIGTCPRLLLTSCIRSASYAESIRSYKEVTRWLVILDIGMATWLSCREAEVVRTFNGNPESDQSTWAFQPIQECLYPFEFFFVPTVRQDKPGLSCWMKGSSHIIARLMCSVPAVRGVTLKAEAWETHGWPRRICVHNLRCECVSRSESESISASLN